MELSFSPEDILQEGVVDAIGTEPIEQRLVAGPPLRVKFGIDPTSPYVHLGRSIVLWRLRAFQELGHEIHLIIGDFTGQIGDTSDKESERPMLSAEEVQRNLQHYEEQMWMVLDPARKDQVHFHRNSEWLSELTFKEIGQLADAFSVNTFIKRELVAKRLEAGSRVSLREMLYPLMQGYDSVHLQAEVEVGGSDQRFNLLAGRTLQEQAGQQPQAIIMHQLISGTDGRKMSSSYGNVVKLLDTPQDKFGKTMAMRDEVMGEYLLVLPRSVRPFTQAELKDRLAAGENPRDLKERIAWSLVALYHGEAEADRQQESFRAQFAENQLPQDVPEVSAKALSSEMLPIIDLLTQLELAPTRSEARRLVEQGGVRLNEEVQRDVHATVTVQEGLIVQVGKRAFRRIVA